MMMMMMMMMARPAAAAASVLVAPFSFSGRSSPIQPSILRPYPVLVRGRDHGGCCERVPACKSIDLPCKVKADPSYPEGSRAEHGEGDEFDRSMHALDRSR